MDTSIRSGNGTAIQADEDRWGAVLMQGSNRNRAVRHPCRYESGLWKGAELRYDAGNRECRGLLKAMKKFRVYLYGVRFIVETDTNTLMHQLNLPVSDLPGAAISRWLAWLRLFDFDVVHVPAEINGAADALSGRPKCDGDSEDEEETEDDIEQMIESDIYAVWGRAVKVLAGRAAQENEPSSELPWGRIIEYLSTVRRPDGLT